MLDHVIVNHAWDVTCPCASLSAQPYMGSDHYPLLLDSGLHSTSISYRFHFDSSWLLVDGSVPLVTFKNAHWLSDIPRSFGPMDNWHFCSYHLRKFLRGWGRNQDAAAIKTKADLLSQIKAVDAEADTIGLSQLGWEHRYDLEGSLMQVFR